MSSSSSSSSSPPSSSAVEDEAMELLTTRVARLEDRLLGTTPLENLRKVDSLWRRLLTAASKVGEAAAALGDGPTLHQLEKELLTSRELNRAPPHHGQCLGMEEKTALIVSHEEEILTNMSYLRRINELKDVIDGPFLENEGEMRRRVATIEAQFGDVEETSAVMSREMDDLLTTYDQVVSMLSEKCIQWEEALAILDSE